MVQAPIGGARLQRGCRTAKTPAEILNLYKAGLFWDPQTFTSQMDFSGAISVQNPNWLLIPDGLNWQGVWNALTAYNELDVVLYTVGNEPHAFVSKTNHNIGNIPPDTYVNWTRLVQLIWREKY